MSLDFLKTIFLGVNMKNAPGPIFNDRINKLSWQKIYEREYGVQYSEVAVSLLADANYHFPKVSTDQVVIPGEGHNTAFYIDSKSWVELVEGLNEKYTSHVKKLEEYEKQFLFDGKNYLALAKKISSLNLKSLSDKELLSLFFDHQDKRDKYSVFAWSAFILNNYVADRATAILDKYISENNRESEKQEIHNSLFHPDKNAAVFQLQYEVEKCNGKLSEKQFEDLFNKFKWLSCLDIHNKPWTKEEFRNHIKSFTSLSSKKPVSFKKIANELNISKEALEYLLMAKRFVYIKDARDDYRRKSVFYAQPLFAEIARRMNIDPEETSYLQTSEIEDFLRTGVRVPKEIISERKKGYVVYLDKNKKLVCLQGDEIKNILKSWNLLQEEEKVKDVTGRIASKGLAEGKVVIIRGVKDLNKVEVGNIFIAVATHPDYVPVMRKVAAIVTDEGGITSHAAIISREFGIPCIVGTKLATKVFKDGDLVKVDADNGTVKILS